MYELIFINVYNIFLVICKLLLCYCVIRNIYFSVDNFKRFFVIGFIFLWELLFLYVILMVLLLFYDVYFDLNIRFIINKFNL